VGRAAEVERLHAALDATTTGRGQVMVLLGEAGVGKSRLVAALGREAAGRGALLLVGRSHESERVLPFSPWIDALRAGGVAADSRLLNDLGRAWRVELHRLLPEIEPGAAASAPGRDPLRLFDAIARLMGLAVTRTVVIVLEDLHWADDMSMRLFAFLGRRVSGLPVLLLGTVREEDAAREPGVRQVLDEIGREPGGSVLHVAPLSRAETGALTRALARPSTPAERLGRLAERIWRMSEGNPFVVTEALRALAAGGVPEEPDRLPLPARVGNLVGNRLNALSDGSRAIAQVAAVIGRQFDFGLLCQASKLGEAQAADAVEELVRARVLHGVGDQLNFVHERIREVVLGQLPEPTRMLLHRHVAGSLEVAGRAHAEPDLDALATHFRRGQVWLKAIEYLAKFAEQAAWRYAIEAAVAALREARELVEHLPKQDRDRTGVDLALRLAHCLYFLGVHAEARQLLLGEQGRLARTGDPALAGRYHFLLARCASLSGDHEEADRRARQALDDAERAGDTATRGHAYYLLAHEAYWTGRSREGVVHAEQAIELLERAGEQWWLGHAWWILCVNLAFLGELDRALEAARRAGAIGEGLGDQRLRSYAAWSTGWILGARGDATAAIAACREAVELAPDPVSRTNARQALGYVWLEAGDSERAIAELEPIVAELARLGVRRPYGLFAAYLAEAYRARGTREQARTTAAGALETTRALGYGYAEGVALRTLGRIALDEADPAAARTRLGEALATFVAIGARLEEGRTRLDLAAASAALGQPAEAVREASTARDLFERLEIPVLVQQADRLAGLAPPSPLHPLSG
jgi:tetratricopeptide (TPR) repeat protein